MTAEQEAEAIQIELELRKRSGAGSSPKQSSSVTSTDANSHHSSVVAWRDATPMQRLGLLTKSIFSSAGANAFLGNAKDVVNAPINMALEAGGPAVGQAVGAATGPLAPVAVPLFGAVGGMAGDALAQAREEGPFSPGRMLSAGVTGAIPGASLAEAGAKKVAREAVKYAVGNVVGKTVESEVEQGRLPTVSEAGESAALGALGAPLAKGVSKLIAPAAESAGELLYSMRNRVLKSLQNEGVVVPPHEIGKGGGMLASIAGKTALQNETAQRNQFVWQKLARQEIGLSKEALPISVEELEQVRNNYAKPYREIQTISEEARQQLQERLAKIAKESDPHEAAIMLEEPATKNSLQILSKLAGADVDALKKARFDASRAFNSFRAGNPTAYDEWVSKRELADKLESQIEDAAASLRDTSLLDRLKVARKKIAQTYSIQEALNRGNGLVDPVYFGRQLDRGENISGNLKKIAEFQLAFNREAVEAGRAGSPGVGSLWPMLAVNQASRGNAPGMIGAAVSATAGGPARTYLLSDFVQKGMLNPSEYQNFSQALARYIAENHPTSRKQSERKENP